MKKESVSPAIVRRLPKYYRALAELSEIRISRVSSKQLGKLTGFNPSQIRQDLNTFGGFGQQGYGYNVATLKENLEQILYLDQPKSMVVIGAGNLGKAILRYEEFSDKGFNIIGAFDRDSNKIGQKESGVNIFSIDDLEEFLEDNPVDIAVITIHRDVAQKYANICIEKGVRAFWNFSSKKLKLTDDSVVVNVWLSESLYTLSFFLGEKQKELTRRDARI